jgi:alpha-galactosidase
MKITIIGGGAYSWTPELVRDIAVTPALQDAHICLMDINPAPLEMAEKLCNKIIAAAKARITVSATLDQDQALSGADYVLVAINTGASATHGVDVDVPLKYGMRSSVGDTMGPAGISRTLRNAPVMQGIARRVHAICPRAWLINVTNPMGTLTRVMCMEHDRTVGYCHEVEWLRLRVAYRFGVPREQVQATTVGVNHMTWVTQLRIAGNPDGLEMLRRHVAEHGPLNDQAKPTPVVQEIYDLFGALPVSLDSHIAEFYGPYAIREVAERYGLVQYSAALEESRVRQPNKAKAEGMLSGAIPINLNHSMEQIAPIIAALRGSGMFCGIGNLPNVGQVDNLPRGAVIETQVLYDSDSAHPLTYGPLRPLLVSTLVQHCLAQELAVQAAIQGDRQLVIEAILTQPHVHDFAVVPKMVDDLLQANREYLPHFFK